MHLELPFVLSELETKNTKKVPCYLEGFICTQETTSILECSTIYL